MIVALALTASLTVTPTSRAMQPGEPVLLTVTSDRPLSAVHATAFGQTTPGYEMSVADKREWRVLIGIDLDVKPGAYEVKVTAASADGPLETAIQLNVRPKTFPTRRLSVDEAFVNPPASARPRIDAEAKETAAIFDQAGASRLWDTFVRPVPQPANSAFGTRSVFNGQPRNAHSGADFLSPAGTPVKAAASGRVVLAKSLYYSGNTVIIDHGLGVFSLFAHLSRIDVRVGDDVAGGRVVGLVGATGRVTGAHLHWTVRVAGARVDPLAVLTLLGPRAPRPVRAPRPSPRRQWRW
ncbi:MAG: M23 family metallopeptidase [Acidobacteria bacterium]|nr:MAG: M23 family metallopeptidase [Acidobacteriota bacterium]